MFCVYDNHPLDIRYVKYVPWYTPLHPHIIKTRAYVNVAGEPHGKPVNDNLSISDAEALNWVPTNHFGRRVRCTLYTTVTWLRLHINASSHSSCHLNSTLQTSPDKDQWFLAGFCQSSNSKLALICPFCTLPWVYSEKGVFTWTFHLPQPYTPRWHARSTTFITVHAMAIQNDSLPLVGYHGKSAVPVVKY